MTREETVPRLFRVYSIVVSMLALAAVAVSWAPYSPSLRSAPLAMALLALGVLAAENLAVYLPGGGSTSLSLPLCVAANVLAGPLAGGIVAGFTLNIDEVRRRRSPWILAFNIGQLVLTSAIAGWTYARMGGPLLAVEGSLRFAQFPAALLPIAGLVVVVVPVNGLLVSLGIGALKEVRALEVWRHISWGAPMQAAMGCLGVAIAQVLAIQPLGLLLFLFPLLVSRQMYQRYIALRDAYRDTVRSLVAAIEAKDHYTRGHSDRVAEYAVAIASQMGLTSVAIERIEFAALLHDLGKVGISGSVLMKEGPLSAEEWSEIREHPMIGARIVERVPYLADIVGAVRSHHERYDGKGYCEGLSGEQVPFEARVLAVADSYDAMTTERPYRPALTIDEAVAEVEAGRGGQFDARVADAFLKWLVPERETASPVVPPATQKMASEDA